MSKDLLIEILLISASYVTILFFGMSLTNSFPPWSQQIGLLSFLVLVGWLVLSGRHHTDLVEKNQNRRAKFFALAIAVGMLAVFVVFLTLGAYYFQHSVF